MAITSLFFIRHGETDFNKRGIVQGSGVDSIINDKGRKQAQAFFDYYQHLDFDTVFASKLQRTHQTLAPWEEKGYHIQSSLGLNELAWGIHEGRVPTEAQRKDFLSVKSRWAQGEVHLKVQGGESPVEGWERARLFMEHIYTMYHGQRLLICSHGRQLRVLLSGLLCGDLSKMEEFNQPNTGLHVLEMKTLNDIRIHTLSDTRHLSD